MNLVRFSNIIRSLVIAIFLSSCKTNYTINRLQFDIAISPLQLMAITSHVQRAKSLAFVHFAYRDRDRNVYIYVCDPHGGKTREVKMMQSEVMHTRCVSSTFSKSCYLYS